MSSRNFPLLPTPVQRWAKRTKGQYTKASPGIGWRERSHYHAYLRNTPLFMKQWKERDYYAGEPSEGRGKPRLSQRSGDTLCKLCLPRPPHRIRTLSTSVSRHSLLAAILRDPDPGARGRSSSPSNLMPASGSQQLPPPKPHPRLPPHPGLPPRPRHERPLLRVTPPNQAQDPLPSPGSSSSHPEDESVDQEDALETSNDWFGL